ncbi:MAG: hypothetical protein IJY28_05190 [Clostridia bacterium]|nr:hypothetical protein [Clostridia bacterium]
MKKRIALILMLTLMLTLLTGCAGTPVVYYTDCNCSSNGTGSTPPVTPAEGALKTGLVITTSIKNSKNAEVADYDVTMVAVLVDDNGIIRDCIIDGIATKVNFDNTGTITSDLTKPVQTKNELGKNYGMVAWGGAKYEWNEQADALAKYAIGKTVAQLKNGAIDASGKAPAGSDLAATATIYLGGYVAAIEAAVANAKHLGAQSGDTLKLASVNSVSGSTSATAEKAGTAQLDATVTALTMKDGVITSCAIDSVQAKVAFDKTGTITTDVTKAVQTKNELGKNYGMVAWGGAKYEWNEQAASFAAYVTGKTAAQVAGIAVTDKNAPAGADLSATVTIAIGDFQALIAKAMK